MNYTITIEQAHLIKLLSILETVPMPLRETWPIYQSIRGQQEEQDKAGAFEIKEK